MSFIFSRTAAGAVLVLAILFLAGAALSWTSPSQSPPNGNITAPVNVGTTNQEKQGGLYVSELFEADGLTVYGNGILSGPNRYFNFGSTVGDPGYGIRDTSGTLEFKNSGGSWKNLQTIVNEYIALGGGSSQWTTSGSNIYYNTGNVGIGATNPGKLLDVNGSARFGANGSSGLEISRFTTAITDVPGSTAGMQLIGPDSTHVVLDVRGNDANDGFYVRVPTTLTTNPTVDKTAFVVKASGNVGIGDATPDHKLDVAGNIGIDASAYLNFGDTDGTNGYGIRDSAGTVQFKNSGGAWAAFGSGGLTGPGTTNYVPKFTGATALANSLIFDNGTNVGIATAAPTQKLDVNGAMRSLNSISISSNASEGGQLVFGYAGVAPTGEGASTWNLDVDSFANLRFFRKDSSNIALETLRITPAGNVGIGITNPAQKLSVAGVIRSTTGGVMFPDGTTQTTAASQVSIQQSAVPAPWVLNPSNNLYYSTASVSCPNGYIATGGGGYCDAQFGGPTLLFGARPSGPTGYAVSCNSTPPVMHPGGEGAIAYVYCIKQ